MLSCMKGLDGYPYCLVILSMKLACANPALAHAVSVARLFMLGKLFYCNPVFSLSLFCAKGKRFICLNALGVEMLMD